MATVTNKRKVLSAEGKFKEIREMENGRKKKTNKKESRRVSGIWSSKFYDPNGLYKQSQISSAFERDA